MIKIIRYILTLLLTTLITIYTIKNDITGQSYFIFLSIYLLYIILNIKDIIKKNKIKDNKKYNLLQIISLLIMIFIFLRTLYDPSFLINSSKYKSVLKELGKGYLEEAQDQTILYLLQNIPYFIGLIILSLIYRKINMEHQESKYNTITLTTLLLSIISIIPTINCFTGDINPYKYLLFTIIILGTEIFFLIKDNNKKREWPIYISWLFNLFAVISIIVNIIIY
ncbi:MAG: hypothetical protein ACI31V_03035 [Bacilli bacterium]